MGAVLIGVDPAKRSHTVEVIDKAERVLAKGWFANTSAGYREMRALVRRWPDRVWVIEGATGVGLHLAQRLVSDGERVVDVPAKLSTRVRAMDTGHGRKNDPADAHAVAVVGLRSPGLRQVRADDERVALKLLSERRRDLVRSRTRAVNQLHQVLMQLIPSGAPKDLSAAQAKELVATVRPRDVARFATADHFASYTGTAPIEASSGDIIRHRLSRAGNRRLNSALHIAAMSNKRYDPRGKAYYQRKIDAKKGHMGALRCLKRRLSDVVFRTMVEDRAAANPGGQMGATLTASAVDQIPKANTSDKPQPGFAAEATPTRHPAKAAS